MRFFFASLVIATAAALSPTLACTSATGSEEGGDLRFDPAAPAIPDDACAPAEDAGSGATWTDLYTDYFGSSAPSSCAGTVGQCHGQPSGLGAAASGYICPPNDVQGCYQGITSPAAGLVMVGDTTDNPTTSSLYLVLRKACGGGAMPLQPATFFFSAGDMARIADWIGAGAPDN